MYEAETLDRYLDAAVDFGDYDFDIELSYAVPQGTKPVVKRMRWALNGMKLERGCENPDCRWMGSFTGEQLSFHHREPEHKLFTISQCWSYSWGDVLAEVAKCDVLCENCHRPHSRTQMKKTHEDRRNS